MQRYLSRNILAKFNRLIWKRPVFYQISRAVPFKAVVLQREGNLINQTNAFPNFFHKREQKIVSLRDHLSILPYRNNSHPPFILFSFNKHVILRQTFGRGCVRHSFPLGIPQVRLTRFLLIYLDCFFDVYQPPPLDLFIP